MAKKARSVLVSKKELRFFGYYFLAGIVLAIILLFFGIPISETLDKFYGVIYMFFIPGLIIFRTIFKFKEFDTQYEEYGYPALISWVLHSLIIAGISFFLKVPVTNLKIYGTSLVITIISAIIFYRRN